MATPRPHFGLCDVPGSFTQNSRLQSNIDASFLVLSSNASYHNFYNTSIGNGSDTVYSMFLCYNYTTPESCNQCIESAANDVQGEDCSYKNEAIVWEEDCQLRYSTQMFFGSLNSSGNFALNNKRNNSDPELFRSTVNQTLNSLTKLAAFNHSTMYATGTAPFESGDMIYALVQCTLDLSQHDCQKCLEIATAEILESFYFSRGARLLSRSCYLRYELYAFYNGDTEGTRRNETVYDGETEGTNHNPTDPLDNPCSYNRGNYTTNSPFDNNLKTLLATLPARAAQNQGFYYASFGDGDDKVFGRALCRGDINSTDCEACLGKASEKIKRQCQSREALMRYDQRCQVEYGSALLKRYNGKYPDSTDLEKPVSDPLRFSRVLKELMGSLSDQAANHSGLMFAAQSRNFSQQISIYGLVQCTRDLSNAQCGECLNSASVDLEGCCGTREGGTVYGGACSEFWLGALRGIVKRGSAQEQAWQVVNEEMELGVADPVLIESSSPMEEIRRCIHIGVLCVQEDPAERPRMSEVVHLLKGGQMPVSKPRRPPVSLGRRSNHGGIHLNPSSTASSSLTESCATALITGSIRDSRQTK
nr:cysteine-rich receptor-like protein kinase 10 [Ipomoea trifida]